MKILIVEDEQRSRIGLKNLIDGAEGNYNVIGEASDGKKALNLIQALSPDVVFTDIRMPFISGIELIRICRSEKIKCEFVIVTAFAEFDYAQKAISLGVTEYLLKPLIEEDVVRTLHHLEKKLEGSRQYNWEQNMSLRKQYPNAHPLILKVLDFIESSYKDKISQKQLAASLGISPEYLSYLFKKETGKTFSRFVQNYRIQMAKSLLRNGSCNKDDVPFLVGFSDEKYFHKVFHDVTGKSVHEFLQNW